MVVVCCFCGVSQYRFKLENIGIILNPRPSTWVLLASGNSQKHVKRLWLARHEEERIVSTHVLYIRIILCSSSNNCTHSHQQYTPLINGFLPLALQSGVYSTRHAQVDSSNQHKLVSVWLRFYLMALYDLCHFDISG